jgi:DNA-binding IclR family transcriptional regulator
VESELVDTFLAECEEIKRTRIATNITRRGTRFAIATTVRNQSGESVASISLVGPTASIQPRVKKFSALLIRQIDGWSQRSVTAREAL